MDLAHLTPDQLRALRPQVGGVMQEQIDRVLDQLAPAILDVAGRPKTETRVRMECRQWCKERGAVFIVDTEQNRPTRVTEGLADLIVLWGDRGGVWFVETKAEDGTQSKDQLKFQRACEAAGIIYVLARGTQDLEKCKRELAARTAGATPYQPNFTCLDGHRFVKYGCSGEHSSCPICEKPAARIA
jgi:hypothetical protein